MLVLCLTGSVSAQSFLKNVKQKAAQAAGKVSGSKFFGNETTTSSATKSSSSDSEGVPSVNDVVPKQRLATLNWDGTVTPSRSSSASALMAELPALPTAEQMARSTASEREAYYRKIASVTARVSQLQESAECSDAETEVAREKIEGQLANLFGLSKAEMEKLNDDRLSDAERDAIMQKAMNKRLGIDDNTISAANKLENMSEAEAEAYIRAHPEVIQQMQSVAMNTRSLQNDIQSMTSGASDLMTQFGAWSSELVAFENQESSYNYENIAKKYEGKLQGIYKQIFATNDAAQVDALYAQADELLYNYRVEAAKEYRASLLRRINHDKKAAAEYQRIAKKGISDGLLPQCMLNRSDLNAVMATANVLEDAYKDIPGISASPVEKKTLYQLPSGYVFLKIESSRYTAMPSSVSGGAASASAVASGLSGGACPLFLYNEKTSNYAVLERGSIRTVTFDQMAKMSNQCLWKQGEKPPYGTYKSLNGKRTVEYDENGSLVIDGMTYFEPISFSKQADRLEWIELDGDKIVLCTYKL